MTLYVNLKRRRRRQLQKLALRACALLGIAVLLWIFWDVGRQSETAQRDLLEKYAQELQQRLLLEEQRATAALVQAESLRREVQALQARYRENVPSGRAAELLRIMQRRLDEGVPPERIAEALQNPDRKLVCDTAPIAREVVIRSLTSRGGSEVADFEDGLITVTLSARSKTDSLAERYFPDAPVRLVATQVGSETLILEEPLPLAFTRHHGQTEYRFRVEDSTRRYGFAQLSAKRCSPEE